MQTIASNVFIIKEDPKEILEDNNQITALRKKFQQKIKIIKSKSAVSAKIRSQSTALLTNRFHKDIGPFRIDDNPINKQPKIQLPIFQAESPSLKNKKPRSMTHLPLPKKPNPQQQFLLKLKTKQKPVYDVIASLNVKPPQPKSKFYEFLSLAPFNRISIHYQYITHFLRQYKFFQNHPQSVINYISKKVMLEDKPPFTNSCIWIIQQGYIKIKGVKYGKGQIVNRELLDRHIFQYETAYETSTPICRVFTLTKYDYQSFIATYLATNFQEFNRFFRKIPIFQKFAELSIQTLLNNLNGKFVLKNEIIYKVGDKVDNLYIVYSAKAFRRIIVELDKTNKIPTGQSQYLIRTFSKSYEFKIIIQKGQIFGFREIINDQKYRNETIEVEQNGFLLCINSNIFKQLLDQNLTEKFKTYNKYPQNYSKLCQIVYHQKQSFKEAQLLKIKAFKQNCKNGNDIYDKNTRLHNFIETSLKKISQNEKISYLKTRMNEKLTRHIN